MTAPATDFSHTLFHCDLSALPLGVLASPSPAACAAAQQPLPGWPGVLELPQVHAAWSPPQADGAFKVIARGVNRFIETIGPSPECPDRFLVGGDPAWSDVRFRAVVTPVSFDGSAPAGGVCGLLGRYRDPQNFTALVLCRDAQVRLLERVNGLTRELDCVPLEFCLGQSLTLTLTFSGARVHGTAGPYTGAVHVYGYAASSGATVPANVWGHGPKGGRPLELPDVPANRAQCSGRIGFWSDAHARLGTLTVECSAAEAERLAARAAAPAPASATSGTAVERIASVPLRGWVSGPNVRLADVDGDGQPEIVCGQRSAACAQEHSLTRLTALTVFKLDGRVLWQAGVPDDAAPFVPGDSSIPDLPLQVLDLYGDGRPVVVCVFGYDIQIRDGRTGRVLFSVQTPDMTKAAVGNDYKSAAQPVDGLWGDEALNMTVAQIAAARFQAEGAMLDVLVQDALHHVAALDAFQLQPLWRHRGLHAHWPWTGVLPGSGSTALLGGVLLDHNGVRMATLPLAGQVHGAAVFELPDPYDPERLLPRCVLATTEGLYLGEATREGLAGGRLQRIGGPAERIAVARLRAGAAGPQIAALHGSSLTFYSAAGQWLSAHTLPGLGLHAVPLHWTGRAERLLAVGSGPGLGLFDGHGTLAVELPADAPRGGLQRAAGLCADGRDGLAAWDGARLELFLPAGAARAAEWKPRPVPHSAFAPQQA